MKQLATKGDVKSARILAREVVRSNKQKDRLSVSKARLGSIGYQLQQQLGMPIHSRVLIDRLTSCLSHGKGHWHVAEVDRDHEVVKSTCQAATNQRSNEGHEYGDDEGTLVDFGMQEKVC